MTRCSMERGDERFRTLSISIRARGGRASTGGKHRTIRRGKGQSDLSYRLSEVASDDLEI